MENALLGKLFFGGLALKLLSKKSSAAPQPHQADPIIDALPPTKQGPAEDYVKVVAWTQQVVGVTGEGLGKWSFPHLGYGGMPQFPGWKGFATKDDLVNSVISGGFLGTEAMLNGSTILWGQIEPVGNLIINLLGHPLDSSSLTQVDKYNLVNSLTWPQFTSTTNPPPAPPTPAMLSAIGNAKVNFLRFASDFITRSVQQGENSGMIFVRTQDAFTSTGKHRILKTDGDCGWMASDLFGHELYMGSYTAMEEYIIFMSFGGCKNAVPDYRKLLTIEDMRGIIQRYLETAGLTDVIGMGASNSTWFSSNFHLADILKAVADAWNFLVKLWPKTNDQAAEDPQVAGDAGLDGDPGSGDYSTYG